MSSPIEESLILNLAGMFMLEVIAAYVCLWVKRKESKWPLYEYRSNLAVYLFFGLDSEKFADLAGDSIFGAKKDVTTCIYICLKWRVGC